MWRWEQVAIFGRGARESEKVKFEKRLEGGESSSSRHLGEECAGRKNTRL